MNPALAARWSLNARAATHGVEHVLGLGNRDGVVALCVRLHGLQHTDRAWTGRDGDELLFGRTATEPFTGS